MTPERAAHLTEEALNDVLIGMETPERQTHLAGCAECRGRLAEFRVGMKAFNASSLAWSEARVGARPARIASARPAMAFAWVGMALAAVILLVIGVPEWRHSQAVVVGSTPVAAQAQGDSSAQIAQDNELMRSVDMALSDNEESAMSEYHLQDGPHAHSRTRQELRTP